jgi:hypothetical protein
MYEYLGSGTEEISKEFWLRNIPEYGHLGVGDGDVGIILNTHTDMGS